MCEKRTRKIKKGSHLNRLREARRIQRMQRLSSPSTSDDNTTVSVSPCPPAVDKIAQNRVILELAWKTVALMHKNRLIQQKIIALKKETSEFVASIMNNPENRKRYVEHIRMYGPTAQAQTQKPDHSPLQLEPKV
ncbi:uncharacterized protein LOC111348798 [Spodoptera litura]|uniref:Uncharacterized protein LOC111348798 n=1 Tax=Spodoptera litura TaxID=69820 RepID=A0A9J7DRL4_SPOLT|nr:uncharacterized protein LOC111348798 [Spodoptera litura]